MALAAGMQMLVVVLRSGLCALLRPASVVEALNSPDSAGPMSPKSIKRRADAPFVQQLVCERWLGLSADVSSADLAPASGLLALGTHSGAVELYSLN
eukprot:gene17265-20542_t